MLLNLYNYRRYLWGSFWADFRFGYAGTALGLFWFIINPLLEALIYSVVFSYLIGFRMFNKGESYTLFLLIGLFPWFTFSQIITRGSNSLNSEAVYLRRLPIPSEVFIAKNTLIAMLSLVVYMLLLIPLNLLFKNSLSWYLLVLPFLILLFTLLGFGMSLIFAHLRVFFPDFGEVLEVLVQLWRWTLPINYSLTVFPVGLRSLLVFNPPYYFIESFRIVFLDKSIPPFEAWLHMFAWVLIFGVLGSLVTHWLRSEVKDQL